MNLNYKELLPANFAPDSRVWIYQCNRLFTIPEALQAEDLLNQFVNGWQSHGTPVKGFATIFFGQFIIIMADENATGVSGCSTDSSVRVIKEIEKLCGVNMFDRTSLAFLVKNKVQLLPLSQLQYALDNKFIDAEIIYFNNLVTTKQELESKWLQPVKESWLAKKIALVTE
jgi:hypothetical protein